MSTEQHFCASRHAAQSQISTFVSLQKKCYLCIKKYKKVDSLSDPKKHSLQVQKNQFKKALALMLHKLKGLPHEILSYGVYKCRYSYSAMA